MLNKYTQVKGAQLKIDFGLSRADSSLKGMIQPEAVPHSLGASGRTEGRLAAHFNVPNSISELTSLKKYCTLMYREESKELHVKYKANVLNRTSVLNRKCT